MLITEKIIPQKRGIQLVFLSMGWVPRMGVLPRGGFATMKRWSESGEGDEDWSLRRFVFSVLFYHIEPRTTLPDPERVSLAPAQRALSWNHGGKTPLWQNAPLGNAQIVFEPGFGAYQGLAQKAKVPFSEVFCWFLQFWGFRGDFKTRAKSRYAPNSGWNAFRNGNWVPSAVRSFKPCSGSFWGDSAGTQEFFKRGPGGGGQKNQRNLGHLLGLSESKTLRNARLFIILFSRGGVGDRYDWTTGVPDNGNEWRKFRAVPRLYPLRSLVCTLFNKGGSRGAFRLPGASGDHFHCTVEPSPGHIWLRGWTVKS